MSDSRVSKLELDTEKQVNTEENRTVNIHRYNRTMKRLSIGAQQSLRKLLEERKDLIEKWFDGYSYRLVLNDQTKEYEYIAKKEEE